MKLSRLTRMITTGGWFTSRGSFLRLLSTVRYKPSPLFFALISFLSLCWRVSACSPAWIRIWISWLTLTCLLCFAFSYSIKQGSGCRTVRLQQTESLEKKNSHQLHPKMCLCLYRNLNYVTGREILKCINCKITTSRLTSTDCINCPYI